MKALREQLWQRCGGYCEKCGSTLNPNNWALHHRKLRSQGGQDAIENVVALHHKCHNLGTKSVHLNPALSTEQGYIVPSWAEPAAWELLLPNGSLVLLSPEGNYETIRKAYSDGW